MTERSLITNGRFLHNLNNWVAVDAVYSAGDGDDHYGVAVLSTGGGYISQTFSVNKLRQYTIFLAVKGALSAGEATLEIKDGDGNIVTTINLTSSASWTDNLNEMGLAPGTTYTITLKNIGATGDIKLDDVWIWHVPVTRTEIAERADDKLGGLATDAGLSTTASGDKTEGDYTYAVDAGLRQYNAINPDTGLPDTRYLEPQNVSNVIDAVEAQMLERLENDYAVMTDRVVGPRKESLSQISEAISRKTGSGSDAGASRAIYQRKMSYGD